MRVSLLGVLLALLALPPARASAQDHLEPERGLGNRFGFDWDYEQKLRQTLLKGASPYHRARMICIPSFGTEWMVTVVREDRGEPGEPDDRAEYFVEYVAASTKIFPERDLRKVALTRRRVPLDRATGEAVAVAWRRMLLGVAPPREPRLGADGTSYHFSRAAPYFDRGRPTPLGGFEAGRIWQPGPETAPADLVALGEGLRDYALAPPAGRDAVGKRVREGAIRLTARVDQRRMAVHAGGPEYAPGGPAARP